VGQRSKVDALPPDVRAALDRKLIDGAFSGYVEIQDWLRTIGFEIGKSSVHRYGSRLEEQIAKLKASAERARAMVEASPDVADDMAQATMRMLQEKLYTVLEAMDDIDPESVDLVKVAKAMAPLVRAGIAQKRHAEETKRQLAEAAEKVTAEARAGRIPNVSAEALARIREIYTGAVAAPQ
jgi:translation initiation factor 2B subunit (eIF-2B alpha/beta/delta family)